MRNLFNRYRRTLGDYQSILSYALLGIIGGLASGSVVLAFELAINQLALLWGVGDGAEGFESLPSWLRFALPASGAVLLGLGFSLIRAEDRETGIVHIISRMHSHYSVLPLRNAVVQFLGGACDQRQGFRLRALLAARELARGHGRQPPFTVRQYLLYLLRGNIVCSRKARSVPG